MRKVWIALSLLCACGPANVEGHGESGENAEVGGEESEGVDGTETGQAPEDLPPDEPSYCGAFEVGGPVLGLWIEDDIPDFLQPNVIDDASCTVVSQERTDEFVDLVLDCTWSGYVVEATLRWKAARFGIPSGVEVGAKVALDTLEVAAAWDLGRAFAVRDEQGALILAFGHLFQTGVSPHLDLAPLSLAIEPSECAPVEGICSDRALLGEAIFGYAGETVVIQPNHAQAIGPYDVTIGRLVLTEPGQSPCDRVQFAILRQLP